MFFKSKGFRKAFFLFNSSWWHAVTWVTFHTILDFFKRFLYMLTSAVEETVRAFEIMFVKTNLLYTIFILHISRFTILLHPANLIIMPYRCSTCMKTIFRRENVSHVKFTFIQNKMICFLYPYRFNLDNTEKNELERLLYHEVVRYLKSKGNFVCDLCNISFD